MSLPELFPLPEHPAVPLNPAVGKVWFVGAGPGDPELITVKGRSLIESAGAILFAGSLVSEAATRWAPADCVVLDSKDMTLEEMSAWLIAQAARCRVVVRLQTSDPSFHGELIELEQPPHAAGIELEVVPGASAINACAALVGAPLTHDFCSISLSDLLTPSPVIARRLDAVAAADFVVALCNPKSGRRTQKIVQAQQLLLRHRKPDTPVAVVKSAYRRRERIEFTPLDRMSDCDIGMLIGNSNTFIRHGLMVTPRGYANKYEVHGDASTRGGECPGRSLSTGLIGWMENLRADHADGETVAALALRHQLPADYIDMVLNAPPDEAAPEAVAVEELEE